MNQSQTIYLKDYQPPAFLVEQVALTFTLYPAATEVISTVQYRRNPLVESDAVLELDGHDMELLSIRLNGNALTPPAYQLQDQGLHIPDLPDAFELEITTRINPESAKLRAFAASPTIRIVPM